MIRIFTKTAYVFFAPKGVDDKPVHTKALSFNEVPDWVRKNPTFVLGVKAEDIEVMDTKEKQRITEAKVAELPAKVVKKANK